MRLRGIFRRQGTHDSDVAHGESVANEGLDSANVAELKMIRCAKTTRVRAIGAIAYADASLSAASAVQLL